MKKSIHAVEHTPIYDFAAYQQRQKQRKRAKLLKNILQTVSALSVAAFTFSMLFLGE